eukprot:bmy_00290T0
MASTQICAVKTLPSRPLCAELVRPRNLPSRGYEPQLPPPPADTPDSQVCGTKGSGAVSSAFPRGGGGGEVTSAPRLAPSPAAWTGFSRGVRLLDSSGRELGSSAGSPAAAVSAAAAVPTVKRLALSTPPRLPGSAERWRSSHSAPGRPRGVHLSGWLSRKTPSGRVSHASNCRSECSGEMKGKYEDGTESEVAVIFWFWIIPDSKEKIFLSFHISSTKNTVGKEQVDVCFPSPMAPKEVPLQQILKCLDVCTMPI